MLWLFSTGAVSPINPYLCLGVLGSASFIIVRPKNPTKVTEGVRLSDMLELESQVHS